MDGGINENSKQDGLCSIVVDYVYYELMKGGWMRCELRGLSVDFPRNFVYFSGNLFQISLLSVSISLEAILKGVVVPRKVGCLACPSGSSFRSSIELRYIAFEFKSELTEIAAKSLSKYPSVKTLCIPADVKSLPNKCFKSWESLSILTFEQGSVLTQIGASALEQCTSLTSITIPHSVTDIGQYMPFRNVYPYNQFLFLPQSPTLDHMPFRGVHPYNQFLFLPHCETSMARLSLSQESQESSLRRESDICKLPMIFCLALKEPWRFDILVPLQKLR
jgi:hypothetical protein